MSFTRRAFDTYKNLQSVLNSFDEDTKIIFVRHGQTKNNLERIAQGRRCASEPLNSTGIAQANETAETLKSAGFRFDMSFTSPAVRAKQTFEIIRDTQNISTSRQYELENLHEIDWGCKIDGLPMSETDYDRLNDIWFGLDSLKYAVSIGDSENLDDVFERAVDALSEIHMAIKELQLENKMHEAPTVLVCGHGFMFGLILTMIATAQYGLSKKPENGKATLLHITKAQNIITNI